MVLKQPILDQNAHNWSSSHPFVSLKNCFVTCLEKRTKWDFLCLHERFKLIAENQTPLETRKLNPNIYPNVVIKESQYSPQCPSIVIVHFSAAYISTKKNKKIITSQTNYWKVLLKGLKSIDFFVNLNNLLLPINFNKLTICNCMCYS